MDISRLNPGDEHYMAYVGYPTQYDFMGATQFRLLCSLGLRSHHNVLDFGCGSLRAGRLLISYLDQNRYFGIEPNKWLIDEAIRNQIGSDMTRIKEPKFDYNEDFSTSVFPVRFDFIVAQSIFCHTGSDLIDIALRNFQESLNPNGVVILTFLEGNEDFDGHGWVYPDCVNYHPSTIRRFAERAGLIALRIPWYHPRQTWYILARDKQRLPTSREAHLYLNGAVLYDPEFANSREQDWNISAIFKNIFKRLLPSQVIGRLRILRSRR